MKKKFLALCLIAVISISMVGCNKQIIDTAYNYNEAVFSLPDGTIVKGKVDSWTDFEDGDQIQVKIDGKTYLVHSSDIVLIAK